MHLFSRLLCSTTAVVSLLGMALAAPAAATPAPEVPAVSATAASAGGARPVGPLLEHRSGASEVSTASTAAVLRPLTPARLADTRNLSTIDGRHRNTGALGPGGVLTLQVTGRGGVPASGAGAVVLTVTAVSPTAMGFVTVWPAGERRPTASNLNLTPGHTTPNTVIAKLGAGGQVSLFNSAGQTHFVVDVSAWLPVGAGYQAMNPARLADSRGFPTIDGINSGFGALPPGYPVELAVLGRGGLPSSGVAAVVLNVTAVPDGINGGWATMWPSDDPAAADVRVSYDVGRTTPAMTVLATSVDGKVTIRHDGGPATHYVVDVLGWFAPSSQFATVPPSGRVTMSSAGGAVVGMAAVGTPEVPSAGVGSVLLNVTARSTEPTPWLVPQAYVSAWPSGQPFPGTSMLNLGPNQSVATGLLPARVGSDGRVSLLASQGNVTLAVSVIGWFGDGTVTPPRNGATSTAEDLELLGGVNAWRAVGRMCGGTPYPPVPPLRWNPALRLASQWHADDMASRSYFSHTSPEGTTPWDRMRAAGYNFGAAGENIAAGAAPVNAVLAQWFESPGHCANMMSPNVTEIGAARSGRTGSTWTWYWAMVVGAPA